MSQKKILVSQHEACYEESAWFACALKALEGVSEEDAFWKPSEEVHSVWEIISHLNFYNNKHLQRFKGINVPNETIEIAETYTTAERDWKKTLADFNAIMSEWKTVLETSDDAKFDEAVSAKADYKWRETISDANLHNAYHIGQIVIVRKLRKNWNEKLGVN